MPDAHPHPGDTIPIPVLAIAADRARRLTGHCLERVAAAKADKETGVGEACAVAAPAGVTGFAAVHCDADPVEAARVRAEARADLATPGFAAAAESGAISPMVRTMLATGTDDATRGAWLADSMRRAPAEAVQRLRAVSLGETPDAVPEHRAPVTDGWVPTGDGGAGAWVFHAPVNFDALAFDLVSRAVRAIGKKCKATLAPVRAFGAIAEAIEKSRWPASPGAFRIGHTFEVDPVDGAAWLDTIVNPLQVALDSLPAVPVLDEKWRADGTASLRIVAQRDDGTPIDFEPGPLLAAFRGLAGDPAPRRARPARRARARRRPRTWPVWETVPQALDMEGGASGAAAPASAEDLARAGALLARCDFDLARPPDEAAWAELLELAASSSRVGHALTRELCHALLRAHRAGRLAQDEAGMAVVDGVRLPLTWRDARERIRVARALRRLPWCDWVFARGEACYAKVRAVVAVATPETDVRWAGELRRRDVAIIEAMVARVSAGDAVGDGATGDAGDGPPAVRPGERPLWPIGRPVTLRCYAEITGAPGRALRRARARLDRWAGRALSSREALTELCRLYLWTEGEPARNTIVYHHGPETRAASDPRRRLAPALAKIEDPLARVLAAFPHLAGRFAEQGLALDASGTRVVRRPARAARRRELREALERALAAVDASPDPRFVPALFRRLQEWRDGPRCRVPWCQNYLFVQYHHGVPVRLRSRRARLAADRGICSVCNAAEGAGLLVIVPLANGGICVTDASGRPLGRRFKPGAHLDAELRARLLAAARVTVAASAGTTPPVEPAVANARGDP